MNIGINNGISLEPNVCYGHTILLDDVKLGSFDAMSGVVDTKKDNTIDYGLQFANDCTNVGGIDYILTTEYIYNGETDNIILTNSKTLNNLHLKYSMFDDVINQKYGDNFYISNHRNDSFIFLYNNNGIMYIRCISKLSTVDASGYGFSFISIKIDDKNFSIVDVYSDIIIDTTKTLGYSIPINMSSACNINIKNNIITSYSYENHNVVIDFNSVKISVCENSLFDDSTINVHYCQETNTSITLVCTDDEHSFNIYVHECSYKNYISNNISVVRATTEKFKSHEITMSDNIVANKNSIFQSVLSYTNESVIISVPIYSINYDSKIKVIKLDILDNYISISNIISTNNISTYISDFISKAYNSDIEHIVCGFINNTTSSRRSIVCNISSNFLFICATSLISLGSSSAAFGPCVLVIDMDSDTVTNVAIQDIFPLISLFSTEKDNISFISYGSVFNGTNSIYSTAYRMHYNFNEIVFDFDSTIIYKYSICKKNSECTQINK